MASAEYIQAEELQTRRKICSIGRVWEWTIAFAICLF